MGSRNSAIVFACGTESHVLTSYVLSVTEYWTNYKVLLLQSHRAIPYAQTAKTIGIWNEVIVLDRGPDEYTELFNELSSKASVLHFYSWGFPHFNRLFSLCVLKGVNIALTDEGLLAYSPRRRLAGWLAQNPVGHAPVTAGFDLDAVKQIWLFSPLMFCEPTASEIREISVSTFYQVCRDHPELVAKFKTLFGFPEDFSFPYKPYAYFRQYFSAIGVVPPEVDAWLDKKIRSFFPEDSLLIKDHPAYSNPHYETFAACEYHGPWEALILLKHIDPSSRIELPKVNLSLSSSVLIKSPMLGEGGYFIFLYRLLEPYTLWRDDVLEIIIQRLASIYSKDIKVLVPTTWEEFHQDIIQIADGIGYPMISRIDGKILSDEEREMLSRVYLKYWQLSQQLERRKEALQNQLTERVAALEAQLAEREGVLEDLRRELSAVGERAAGLEVQLVEREGVLEDLRRELSAVGERAAALEAQLAEREGVLEDLRGEIETKAQELDTLRQQKAALEQELASVRDYLNQREQVLQDLNNRLLEIYSSTAWKIIRWMWKVRLWLFPRGSWRERVGKSIFLLLRDLRANNNLHSSRNIKNAQGGLKLKPISEQHWGIMATPHTLFIAYLIYEQLKKHGCNVTVMTRSPKDYSYDFYIVICPQMFDSLPPGEKRIVYQLEQSVSSRWFTDEYFKILRESLAVLDYSLQNIGFLAQNGILYPHVYYLPIGGSLSYGRKVDILEKEYDILFYGDYKSSPRRQEMLDAVSKEFNVKVIDETFGLDMVNSIRRSRIVLNLHYYENGLLETPRIMECLSLGVPVVSETSINQFEHPELDEAVRFFTYGSIPDLLRTLRETLQTPPSSEKITNAVTASASRFEFMFIRFLIGIGILPASSIDMLPTPIGLGDKVVLSLPETIERRRAIIQNLPSGFTIFDGLRYSPGWIGCGLSYSYLAKKALERGLNRLTVIEDDVLLPDDFEHRLQKIYRFLDDKEGSWDIFVGLIADLHPDVKILGTENFEGINFVFTNKMTSTVFNIYSKRALQILASWNPNNLDPKSNTIDRFLESQLDLRIVTTLPYQVGQREDLQSTIWGFANTQYSEMIRRSERELQSKVWLQHFLESD